MWIRAARGQRHAAYDLLDLPAVVVAGELARPSGFCACALACVCACVRAPGSAFPVSTMGLKVIVPTVMGALPEVQLAPTERGLKLGLLKSSPRIFALAMFMALCATGLAVVNLLR